MLSNGAVLIRARNATLDGHLSIAEEPALILIVGLGGTFHQERIHDLVAELQQAGFATLVADLLTPDEQQFDSRTGHFRVDARLLADRVRQIVAWLCCQEATRHLPLGIFACGFAASASIHAEIAEVQPFALVLYTPRLDALGDDERTGRAPTLLLPDDPGLSATDEELAAANAARQAAAWFRRHAPVLTPG